jgi:hypothetical protein
MGYFSQLSIDNPNYDHDPDYTHYMFGAGDDIPAPLRGGLTYEEKMALAASFFHGNHSSQVMGFLMDPVDG